MLTACLLARYAAADPLPAIRMPPLFFPPFPSPPPPSFVSLLFSGLAAAAVLCPLLWSVLCGFPRAFFWAFLSFGGGSVVRRPGLCVFPYLLLLLFFQHPLVFTKNQCPLFLTKLLQNLFRA